jgi:hypothetical protein
MNKPYFEVGEEVIVARACRQEFNGEDVIIGYDYGKKEDAFTGEVRTGHDYQLSKDPVTWVTQSALRKKHKPLDKLTGRIEELEKALIERDLVVGEACRMMRDGDHTIAANYYFDPLICSVSALIQFGKSFQEIITNLQPTETTI